MDPRPGPTLYRTNPLRGIATMNAKRQALDDEQVVRRYMGFSRFVWLLQNRQLWLAQSRSV